MNLLFYHHSKYVLEEPFARVRVSWKWLKANALQLTSCCSLLWVELYSPASASSQHYYFIFYIPSHFLHTAIFTTSTPKLLHEWMTDVCGSCFLLICSYLIEQWCFWSSVWVHRSLNVVCVCSSYIASNRKANEVDKNWQDRQTSCCGFGLIGKNSLCFKNETWKKNPAVMSAACLGASWRWFCGRRAE